MAQGEPQCVVGIHVPEAGHFGATYQVGNVGVSSSASASGRRCQSLACRRNCSPFSMLAIRMVRFQLLDKGSD